MYKQKSSLLFAVPLNLRTSRSQRVCVPSSWLWKPVSVPTRCLKERLSGPQGCSVSGFFLFLWWLIWNPTHKCQWVGRLNDIIYKRQMKLFCMFPTATINGHKCYFMSTPWFSEWIRVQMQRHTVTHGTAANSTQRFLLVWLEGEALSVPLKQTVRSQPRAFRPTSFWLAVGAIWLDKKLSLQAGSLSDSHS